MAGLFGDKAWFRRGQSEAEKKEALRFKLKQDHNDAAVKPKPKTDLSLLEEGAISAAFDDAAAERAEEIAPLYRAWDKALAKDLRPHRTDPRLLEEGALPSNGVLVRLEALVETDLLDHGVNHSYPQRCGALVRHVRR